MLKDLFEKTNDLIKKSNKVAIAGHLNPDGDCVGSICGLTLILEAMGKEVYPFCQITGKHLAYIPGTDKLLSYQGQKDFDLFIMVDLGDRARLGECSKLIEGSKFSINFDHHQVNEGICNLVIQEKEASSTCEIIARFAMDAGLPITENAATALFAGIITDSNRFLYDTARSACMRIGAGLLDLGADAKTVYLNEYQKMNPNFLAFQGKVISTAEFFNSGRIALANITGDMLSEYKLSMPEAEAVVDTLRNLDGVEIAVIVKDVEDKLQKLSLRSKEFYNVSKLASEFSGGGHIKAAGASLHMSNEKAYKTVKARLSEISLEPGAPQ